MTSRQPSLTASILRLDSVKTHCLAVAILVLVTVVRWAPSVLSPTPLFDEAIYLDAFRTAAAGESPYSVYGYYYPPPCAVVGGWLISNLGQTALMMLIRGFVVLGLVVTLWLSLVWWRTSARRRVIVGVVYLCLAPPVGLGLRTGNMSFLIIGLIVLAMMIWRERPVVSGLMLGSSVSMKPIAPIAILVLLVHRPLRGGYRQIVAGLIGSVTMFVSLFPLHEFREMLSQNIASLSLNRSFSLHRLLGLAGLDVHPLAAMTIVAVIAVFLARLRPFDEIDLLCLSLTAAILAVPLIWTHTLLLTLPVQVLALLRAVERRHLIRTEPGFEGRRGGTGRYELWMVVIAVAAIQLAEGSGSVDRMSAWIQLIALGVPFVAPAALAGYVLATSPNRSTSATG